MSLQSDGAPCRLNAIFHAYLLNLSKIMDQTALDATDRKILDWLQRAGRITNAELAERVNLSASACLRRVQRLEQSGVIEGYAARLSPAAVGRPTMVFVEISLHSQAEDALEAFEAGVRACPEILECHLMAGQADYLLKVAVADTADFARIHRDSLARLPGVRQLHTSFALRTVVSDGAMPV